MLYFQGVDGIFGGTMVFFGSVESGEMLDFSMFCRSGYRTRKWVFRHGNNRYAIFGNRTFVLKCKPRPIMA